MLNIFRPFAIIINFNIQYSRISIANRYANFCMFSVVFICSGGINMTLFFASIRITKLHSQQQQQQQQNSKKHIEYNMCIDSMPLMNISTILVRCMLFFLIVSSASMVHSLYVCVCSSWLYNLKQFPNLSTKRKWLTVFVFKRCEKWITHI